MKTIKPEELSSWDRIKKLNLINSLSGIKPGNLIGTKSLDGFENLAVFSSVVHLGSNPPLMGFIMRPSSEVRRDTMNNILESKYYTINHIPEELTERAHFTSAKFNKEVSEFKTCGFSPEYFENFSAPFLAESNVKIGLKYRESIEIKSNNTVMVIGEIQLIKIKENLISEEGYIDLELAGSAGISGLNSYYKVNKIADYAYARPENTPKF